MCTLALEREGATRGASKVGAIRVQGCGRTSRKVVDESPSAFWRELSWSVSFGSSALVIGGRPTAMTSKVRGRREKRAIPKWAE